MAFVAASVQQGLTTYAANKWVDNFDNVMTKLFDFDQENIIHTILYAMFMTLLVVIFSRFIDDLMHDRDDN